eukprot:268952-Pelagomonas_calceolata.AAC.2
MVMGVSQAAMHSTLCPFHVFSWRQLLQHCVCPSLALLVSLCQRSCKCTLEPPLKQLRLQLRPQVKLLSEGVCALIALQGMDRIWGQGEHVQVIHPGGECIAGREMVGPGQQSRQSGRFLFAGVSYYDRCVVARHSKIYMGICLIKLQLKRNRPSEGHPPLHAHSPICGAKLIYANGCKASGCPMH